MSRRPFFAALVALAIAVSTGCGGKWNDPAIPAVEVNEILPLAVGNQWTYVDSTFHNTTGALQGVDSSRVAITGYEPVVIDGVHFDVYDWTAVDPEGGVPDTISLLMGTTANGIYLYGGRSSLGRYLPGRLLQYRYPAYLNDTWNRRDILFNPASGFSQTSDTLMQCSDPSTTFDTPAGAPACTEYYLTYFFFYPGAPNTSHRFERYLYFAPGVGYMGRVDKLDGVVRFSKRLKRYALQPASPAAPGPPAAVSARVHAPGAIATPRRR